MAQTQDEQGYNGWANFETWNVALWLQNDEGLYSVARDYKHRGYKALAETLRECAVTETPDNIAYNDSGLDVDALNAMLDEI